MQLKFNPLWKFTFVAILIAYSACRKADQVSKSQNHTPNHSLIEDKFFNSNRTNDPIENALVEFLKIKNINEHFVEQTVNKIGYPRWDKTVTTTTKPGTAGRGYSDSSLATYYVPFVRDSQNFVNASLVIKTYPSDTTFAYKCDWQYSQKQNNINNYADSAEYYAIFFMVLDKAVFGHTQFTITDTTLFRHNNHKLLSVRLESLQVSGRNSLIEPIEVCQEVTMSWQDCPWNNTTCAGPGGTCDNCWQCTSSASYTYCWIEWIETGGGGAGPGGTGGTGGGSGNGGGSTPPNNPCGGPVASRNQVTEGCGPGWNPVPGLTPAQLAISTQLNGMLAPGDYFYFLNTLDPNQSLSFSSVAAFNNYLLSNIVNQNSDLTTPPTIINQNEKIEHGKFNLTFIGGVDISCKLSKVGSTWQLTNVTSTDYGVTLGWSWDQTDFSQSISGNEITLTVEGYVRYNIFVDGWGTVYKQKMKFQVKINNQTGKITSLSKA